MIWIRDFEKKFMMYMLIGFWWVLNWMLITFITMMWVNLPSDNPIINLLGLVALFGFVFFQVSGIIILIKGLTLDLLENVSNRRK